MAIRMSTVGYVIKLLPLIIGLSGFSLGMYTKLYYTGYDTMIG